MTFRYQDSAWVKQAFMLLDGQSDPTQTAARVATLANLKFTDTTLGGSFVINPLPQYTYLADPKRGGAHPMKPDVERASPGYGQGRYYSDTFDDHNQIITMRFGVPQYNSIWSFYGAAINNDAALLAKTGRGPSTMFEIGRAAAYGVATAIGGIPIFIYGVYRFLTQKPVSRYYYLKPTMMLYWNAVSSMLNQLAVNMGITPYAQTEDQKKWFNVASSDAVMNNAGAPDTAALLKLYSDSLGGIVRQDGSIDVYAMATKAQRMADVYYNQIKNIVENNNSFEEIQAALKQFGNSMLLDNGPQLSMQPIRKPDGSPGSGVDYLPSYVQKYFSIASYSGTSQVNTDSSQGNTTDGSSNTESINDWQNMTTPDIIDLAKAELEDGAAFVSFRVDATGPVSESFSNQVGESDVAQKANSISAQARSVNFDIAGGDISNGIIGGLVEGSLNLVKGFVTGLSDFVGLSSLAGLAGGAFLDFPDTWQSSIAQMPSSNYTLTLRSPYGNILARYLYLYVPMCMLLAGALPLATGPSSYTSPFICELYSRSRSQIRLGMIDSMQITRGGGNIPFGVDDGPLQIDISFSIKDLSSLMYMPIAPSANPWKAAGAALGDLVGDAVSGNDSSGQAGGGDKLLSLIDGNTYSDDTTFTDYMAVLGGLTLQDQIYVSQKWRLNMAKTMLNYESWRSPGRFAALAVGTLPGRLVQAWSNFTNRP